MTIHDLHGGALLNGLVEQGLRLGTLEDHVGAAIFLASDASEWVCPPAFG
jgi:hypothetical protein